MTEEQAMRRALDLALLGWGRVHPNPMVGAVVLREESLVAEGYHAEYGQAHAERVAIEEGGERVRGGTLVITLEPCRHVGKQPPCTDLVLSAGISRVVIAQEDPNPVARGGADLLREAGVEVVTGLAREEAAVLNAMYLHQHRHANRPFVALKLATSLDARIADSQGNSRWISGEQARDFVHWLRAGFDAIGIGGETARRDDPSLTVRGSVVPRVPPARVVFTRGGNLPMLDDLIRRGPSPVIVAAVGADSRAPGYPPGVIPIQANSLPNALELLRQQGIGSLLVEGGGGLAAALLEQDLVDRYYWIQSPFWLGTGVNASGDLPAQALGRVPRWHPVERRALGNDTLLVLDRA